jgi:hypothetical protein
MFTCIFFLLIIILNNFSCLKAVLLIGQYIYHLTLIADGLSKHLTANELMDLETSLVCFRENPTHIKLSQGPGEIKVQKMEEEDEDAMTGRFKRLKSINRQHCLQKKIQNITGTRKKNCVCNHHLLFSS